MTIKHLSLIVFLIAAVCRVNAQSPSFGEKICGKWMSEAKDMEVEVVKDNNEYQAKIIWFRNDDKSKAMGEWTDKHNPDKALRDRKILGMNVVSGLVYNAKGNSWEHGRIYDAQNGKYWDASAYLTNDGLLKVTGYWHLKFIGHTMTFKKTG